MNEVEAIHINGDSEYHEAVKFIQGLPEWFPRPSERWEIWENGMFTQSLKPDGTLGLLTRITGTPARQFD